MTTNTADKLIIGVAILAIAALEAIAMVKGIDGSFFGLTISAISALAGYHANKVVNTATPPKKS